MAFVRFWGKNKLGEEELDGLRFLIERYRQSS